ncbi:MAG: hypothetical protein H7Y42_10635 [Chitinophagaceae bacterium]|nr:hypothetical protein [Chitinophagaceae bacterium]
MEFNIINPLVAERVSTCIDELDKIDRVLGEIGVTSHPAPFLTRYSIVRSCGTIEYGFKSIVSDIHEASQSPQLKNFIDAKFRNSSMNPSYENICKSLKAFDDAWSEKFKKKVNELPDAARIKSSLKSLNEARNQFAHGGSPVMSFTSVISYFEDALRILEVIESVVTDPV